MAIGVDFQAIVVGAGPCGSTAARKLAEQGIDTTIVEKAEFPRYKTCGGGIIGVTSSCVPPGLPIKEEIYETTFTLNGRKGRTRRSGDPLMSTVDRTLFDAWLLDEACEAGAVLSERTSAKEFQADSDHIVLHTDEGDISARYLIDASGTSSRLARQVGVRLAHVDLGRELELRDPTEGDWRGRVHLDWGPLPGSYAWLFPKGDVLTVGVIGVKGHPQELQDYLDKFVAQLGLTNAERIRDTGHLTRCRMANSPLGTERVLLAGDSAGLLEPWTREGISFAVRSGSSAAEAVATGIKTGQAPSAVLQNYVRSLRGTLLAEMSAGASALEAFSQHPEAFHFLLSQTPFGWKYFSRITTGDTNLARAMRHKSTQLAVGLLKH